MHSGTLYVVSTPIGNLDDITLRAIDILKQVDLIAAEDTRHSKRLLTHFAIDTPMIAYHDHSDDRAVAKLLAKLAEGKQLALISDAGTPMIADPGYRLINAVLDSGAQVVPIPGVSALTTALSVAGLATDRVTFEGFLPAKAEARHKSLLRLQAQTRTLVFYESPHRIVESLAAMIEVFGDSRQVVVARELTKRFETILRGSVADVHRTVVQDSQQQRGEFVVLVAGAPADLNRDETALREMLTILLTECSVKQAASLAAKMTGAKKNYLYQLALEMTDTH